MKSQTITSNKGQEGLWLRDRQANQHIKPSKLFLAFRSIWQYWIAECRRSTEPKIWQTLDQWGNTWWHAYNPATGRCATRESETQILEWIDQRVMDE